MLCFVKNILERIKDVDCLCRYGVVVDRELYFLKAWQKSYDYWQNYDAETNNSAVKKRQESCKKNFEDETNNKQFEVKDDTHWSNLNQ